LDHFQPEQAPRWDPKFCADKLILCDNNRSVVLRAYGNINGVQSVQPCSAYSVQIIHGRFILIGFAPRSGFQKNNYNYRNGWFFNVYDGTLWAQNSIRGRAYGNGVVPEGSVVTAIHDSLQGQIEFLVNGISLGIAFTNVPHDELFAAADISDTRAMIRILDTILSSES
jgi:hypothetical protein